MRNFLYCCIIFFGGFAVGTNLMAYTVDQNREFLMEKWELEAKYVEMER